jgi:hypothetical protein
MSDLPKAAGVCYDDIGAVANVANSAQRRLLMAKEAGDEGWYGTFAHMTFWCHNRHPYLTCPRAVARIEAISVCGKTVPVQNQFFDYQEFGNRRMTQFYPGLRADFGSRNLVSRNNVPTFRQLGPGSKYIRVYASDSADLSGDKSVLIQGLDSNWQTLTSWAGPFSAQGECLTLTNPFAQLVTQMNEITGIQKYVTRGPVQFFQVDPVTGEQELILTMEPSEQVASYRRYYLDRAPYSCGAWPGNPCSTPQPPCFVPVEAIVKLDLVPVQVDSDYCLIQNIEALTAEAQSARYSRMDTTDGKSMAAERHKAAIGYLQGELAHYLGVDKPVISFRPFGSAALEKQKIGSLI